MRPVALLAMLNPSSPRLATSRSGSPSPRLTLASQPGACLHGVNRSGQWPAVYPVSALRRSRSSGLRSVGLVVCHDLGVDSPGIRRKQSLDLRRREGAAHGKFWPICAAAQFGCFQCHRKSRVAGRDRRRSRRSRDRHRGQRNRTIRGAYARLITSWKRVRQAPTAHHSRKRRRLAAASDAAVAAVGG